MDWTDQPAHSPATEPQGREWWPPADTSPSPGSSQATPSPSRGGSAFPRVRRTVATALLAVGLLTVGGVAAVFAADPGTSPAPSASSQPADGGSVTPTPGTRGQQPPGPRNGAAPNGQGGPRSGHNCPNMGGSGSGNSGSGNSGSIAPSTPSNGSATPSGSDL